MKATITEQHAWLHRLVGAWESEMPGPDGGAPHRGTETVTLLGDAWVQFNGRGTMPDGSTAQMQLTLGYDPAHNAFVGTWIGSMMNHLWVYRGGTLDAAARVLSLPSIGPAFDGSGALISFRDEIEIVSDDERLLHGNCEQPDGRWTRFMTARYRRIR